MTLCTPGSYCSSRGLSDVKGVCAAGFYCGGGSTSEQPVSGDGINGKCQAGYYCPANTSAPIPCSPGQYMLPSNVGSTTTSDCLTCPAGSYCPDHHMTKSLSPCNTQYYCAAGSGSDTPAGGLCDEGHYCDGGGQQIPCPAGTFQFSKGSTSCDPCPGGHYCNKGQTNGTEHECQPGYYCEGANTKESQTPCLQGTFSSGLGQTNSSTCTACNAGFACDKTATKTPTTKCQKGYYCKSGAVTATPSSTDNQSNNGQCPKGHYCVEQTVTPSKCHPGTFNKQYQGAEIGDCESCTAGYYCDGVDPADVTGPCEEGFYCPGGSQTKNDIVCPVGAFCPAGSSGAIACPKGTYNGQEGLKAKTECTECEPGYYCPNTNQTEVDKSSDKCHAGYYCPSKSQSGDDPSRKCPVGNKCPEQSEQPVKCIDGTYQDNAGQEECKPCDDGKHCPNGIKTEECPKGSYCKDGVRSLCPRGTFGAVVNLPGVENCTQCSGGRYCQDIGRTSAGPECAAGFYCDHGVDVKNPSETDGHTGIGGVCPVNHYCQRGTAVPVKCSDGYYTASVQQESCTKCDAGFQCIAGDKVKCPEGHYCKEGTGLTPQKCPEGTYRNETGGSTSIDCYNCPAGKYCAGTGKTTYKGECWGGYFCKGGSKTPNPPVGGNKPCYQGYYCPNGTTEEISCPVNKYCERGEAEPTGTCDPGYYCVSKATRARPSDGVTGNRCPAGSYCMGDNQPVKCSEGTYYSRQGAEKIENCVQCDAGYYCQGEGNEKRGEMCPSGYYCPTGTGDYTTNLCPEGHMCPQKTKDKVPCERGEYQNDTGSAGCKNCPPGYYCDIKATKDYSLNKCPSGHYCPARTTDKHFYKCPIGYYNPNKGSVSEETGCLPCKATFACNDTGIATPTVKCNPGYYCKTGAKSASPVEGDNANLCTKGRYCPLGTEIPINCPTGRFGNETNRAGPEDCFECTPGMFCNNTGLKGVEGVCEAGYYCPAGSTTPTALACTTGHYCPKGSPAPVDCPQGTFVAGTQAVVCDKCTPGKYCGTAGLISPTDDCKAGHYCPEGQIYKDPAEFICPAGYHCPEGSSAKQPCPDAKHAEGTGQANCTDCSEGFYCTSDNPVKQKCPKGRYCPEGTGVVQPKCSEGTFGDAPGLASAVQCLNCTDGHYCPGTGRTTAGPVCAAGHYCKQGNTIATPLGSDPSGGECPKGYYCRQGTTDPVPCEVGYYQTKIGQETCDPCPAGYLCNNQGMTAVDDSFKCPVGFYCPLGTSSHLKYPCPVGTFRDNVGAAEQGHCLQCTPGFYCMHTNQTSAIDKCTGGWYCKGGTTKPTNMPADQGGICPVKHYCPIGSTTPKLCDAGYQCPGKGLSEKGASCPSGKYCPQGSGQGQNCDAGHYCPGGKADQDKCPIGTYVSTCCGKSQESCRSCPRGYYCNTTGLTTGKEDKRQCPAGYYCPEGTNSSTPSSSVCQPGYKCPRGSSVPVKCPSGTFQNVTEQESCQECPEGSYCDSTVDPVIEPTICPKGSFCLKGTVRSNQYMCKRGTYNPLTGAKTDTECMKCEPGYACPSKGLVTSDTTPCSAGFYCKGGAQSVAPRQDVNNTVCPEGHYCEVHTVNPEPCPRGTYSKSTGNKKVSQCKDCDPGFYCDGTDPTRVTGPCEKGYYCSKGADNSKQTVCDRGAYCRVQTSVPTKCDIGYYNADVGQNNKTSCLPCTPGYYCPFTGTSNSTIYQCLRGYYCPEGSRSKTQEDCPKGSYCPTGSQEPLACERGTFTKLSKQYECTACDAGKVCDNSRITNCPAGHYCESGTYTGTEIPCPKGGYRDTVGAQRLEDCIPCPGGMACNEERLTIPGNKGCEAGFWCLQGSNMTRPLLGFTSYDVCSANLTTGYMIAGICPKGHYCPAKTTTPKPCPAGTYGATQQLSECVECVEGHYCEAQTDDYTTNRCPVGHYCPAGTTSPHQYPCPAGKISNVTGRITIEQCQECPGGYYCPTTGQSKPADQCKAGYYCTQGSTKPRPEGIGGNICPKGHYCTKGSTRPISCPEGRYCSSFGLSNWTGICNAGYWCKVNATRQNPNDENEPVSGIPCPVGRWCPGDTAPVKCLPGTYNPSNEGASISSCILCEAGYYCPADGQSSSTDKCPQGYYCEQGQTSGTTNPCPPGHKCPIFTTQPIPCPAGTYQGSPQQSSCQPCVAGFYCDNIEGPVTNYTRAPCPKSYYCLEGSKTGKENPCPKGTYNNLTGLTVTEECQGCLPKFACDVQGLEKPVKHCNAGYFCKVNATSPSPPTPTDNSGPCTRGHYCEEGTDDPVACPDGYFRPSTGGTSSDSCYPCTAGNYCNTTALTEVTGPCDAGSYCPRANKVSSPQKCREGYYCPQGTKAELPCPVGTFSNIPSLASANKCTNCTAGKYCNETAMTQAVFDCDQGYYCPVRSTKGKSQACKVGMYCPGGTAVPKSCLDGKYTKSARSHECLDCPAGKYCVPVQWPEGPFSPGYKSCTPGYYCPVKTSQHNMVPCPGGTYNSRSGISKVSQCRQCTAGKACPGLNNTAASVPCKEGYYCTSGVNTSTPNGGHTGRGGRCPVGNYCTTQSTKPKLCESGTYNNDTGMAMCKTCPEGYYCPEGSSFIEDKKCAPGYYCPVRTKFKEQHPCHQGKMNPEIGSTDESACIPCSPGHYCPKSGLANYTAQCSGGWYCVAGSISSKPSQTSQGGECTPGHYCPAGSSEMTDCPETKYCQQSRLAAPQGLCAAGHYCTNNSQSRTQHVCRAGYWCTAGSSSESPCPEGTYSPSPQLRMQEQCLPCTGGYYCATEGLSQPTAQCTEGHYCPSGETQPEPQNKTCPAGYKCPQGSVDKTACPTGTYQNETKQSVCKPCPESYYCNALATTSFATNKCPTGHYCPEGTKHEHEHQCPEGTFNDKTMIKREDACTPCTAGKFCAAKGLSAVSGDCSAGYYCPIGSKSGEVLSHYCPAGAYCEAGIAIYTNCSRGTNVIGRGNTKPSDCKPCPAGKYCPDEPSDPSYRELLCTKGYVCKEGVYVERPNNTFGYQCPVGHYCPTGSSHELQCLSGTYQSEKTRSTCDNCPAGTTCPDKGMSEPQDCPIGKYCPEKNKNSFDCPRGHYGNRSNLIKEGDCTACDIRHYCNESGLSSPTGQCDPGYYCRSKATQPNPAGSDDNFGDCKKGQYCEKGSYDGTLCPVGTYNNQKNGIDVNSCIACQKGRFCKETGLSSPTGFCEAGYYCPEDEKTKTSTPSDFVCPKGHYCPRGSYSPVPCPKGTYANRTTSSECETCPPGKMCLEDSGTITSALCKPYHYCQQGTVFPIQCPMGTYTDGDEKERDKPSDCHQCPTGKYCTNGTIAGDCVKGYYCKSGNSDPTPNNENGNLCPKGYYCPEGCVTPQICPAGTIITIEGAHSESQCGSCEPGFICSQADPIPQPCLPGWYCPGSAVPEIKAVQICPLGTYNSIFGAKSSDKCLPCKAGWLCSREGLSFPDIPCPSGHYCMAGSNNATRCRNGTYQDTYGAKTPQNCKPCPGGSYCPPTVCKNENATCSFASTVCEAASTNESYVCDSDRKNCQFTRHHCDRVALVFTTKCTIGNVCPPTSSNAIACVSGDYCPEGRTYKENCTVGFYCPGMKKKLKCTPGLLCPERSEKPISCMDNGYCEMNDATEVTEFKECPRGTNFFCNPDFTTCRTSKEDSCKLCDPGYFTPDSRIQCQECPAGIVCPAGAWTNNPNTDNCTAKCPKVCSPGFYCPVGTGVERPCPKGHYGINEGSKSLEECQPCKENTFNPYEGQSLCTPCGSESFTAGTGSTTCVCFGNGKKFQPSNKKCPCKDGYDILPGRDDICVPKIYPLCSDKATRADDGLCYTTEQWGVRCAKVCGSADKYVSVDKELGVCRCKVDDLEKICDSDCRIKNKQSIQLVCATPNYLEITEGDNTKQFSEKDIKDHVINHQALLGAQGCDKKSRETKSVFLTDRTSNGFKGVYEPTIDSVETLFNNKNSSTRRRRSVTSSNKGIDNPIACIDLGTTILYTVSPTSYPVHKANSLYNTNRNFDNGPLAALKEKLELQDSQSQLFAYTFNQPGTFVLYMSDTPEKYMKITVMDVGTQCSETGPFFEDKPSTNTRNGVKVQTDDLILEPDWVLIGALLLSGIVAALILIVALVLFKRYGWQKRSYVTLSYRAKAKNYNLDEYASKGSVVRPAKKVHPKTHTSDTTSGNVSINEKARDSAYRSNDFVIEDEFWDYDTQVDIEGFTSSKLYEHLDSQGHTVLTGLSKQKQEAKGLYMKVSDQNESLKGLWVAKMRLRGKDALATAEDLQDYEERRRELDEEIERRKRVGLDVGKILLQQNTLLTNSETKREEHQVQFNAQMREVMRDVGTVIAELNQNTENTDVQEAVTKLEDTIAVMSQAHSRMCQDLGAWAVIFNSTGAPIVYPDNPSVPIPIDELLDDEGLKEIPGLIDTDPVTNLLVPAPGLQILLADNETVDEPPPNCFIHPRTGRVINIEGNVMLDPTTTSLVIVCDSCDGKMPCSDKDLIPYITYPVINGVPVTTSLQQVEKKSDLYYNSPIADKVNGLFAPTLGVTIHPETRQLLPVAGTHLHPVTNLRVPIELGGMMVDHSLGQAVPIMGVTLNPETGEVEPIGGRSNDSYEVAIEGEIVPEPLSGLPIPTTGLYQNTADYSTLRTFGDQQSLMTSVELSTELLIIDTIHELKEALMDGIDVGQNVHTLQSLTKALRDARMGSKVRRLHKVHNTQRMLENCVILQENGGCAGNMEHKSTGQLLPLLIGAWINDPAGTGIEVPILSYEHDTVSGLLVPIGGTMEDPNGQGPVPITLGAPALDHATNQVGPVCGAMRKPDDKLIIPLTLGSTPPSSNKGSPIQISIMEEELVARQMFWRRQRVRETEISGNLVELRNIIVDALPESLEEMKEFQKDVEELLNGLEREIRNIKDGHTKETKRRGDSVAMYAKQLPPAAVAIATENDEEEYKRESDLQNVCCRVPELIQRHMNKVEAELNKFLERCARSAGGIEAAHEKHEAMTERLQNEIKIQLTGRLNVIDEKSSSLEYIRERAELCGEEAKLFLAGIGTINWSSQGGMYGELPVSSSSHKDLIPLIEKLIELLKSSVGKQNLIRALAGPLPPGASLVQTMQYASHQPSVIQSQERIPQAKLKLLIPILEEDEDEAQEGKLFAVPSADLISQFYNTAGELLNLTYKAGKLYDTDDNLITSLLTHGDIEYGDDGRLYTQDGDLISLLFRPDGTSYPINYSEEGEEKKKKIRKQPTRLKVTISETNPRKVAMRQMLEKHTLETVELEDALNKKKIELVNKIIGEAEERKRHVKKKIQSQLRDALQNSADTDDKNAIVMKYAELLDQETEEVEMDKKKALREMMEKMADEIVEKKTALKQKHLAEIDAAGLTEEVSAALPGLTQVIVPNRSKITEDLELLAKQQEILAAEMKKYLAEDMARAERSLDKDIKKELDNEMEERCRRMTALGTKSKVVTQAVQTEREKVIKANEAKSDKLADNMKKRMEMKQRQRRKRRTGTETEDLVGKAGEGTEEEVYETELPDDISLQEDLLEEIQLEADLKDATLAMMEVMREFESKEEEDEILFAIDERLKSELEGSTDAILAEYSATLKEVKEKHTQNKDKSAASLTERLQARKKLREDMQARKQSQDVIDESGLGKIGLSTSEVLHEVNSIQEKINSTMVEENEEESKELLKKLDMKRNSLVVAIAEESEQEAIREAKEDEEKKRKTEEMLDEKMEELLQTKEDMLEKELQEREDEITESEKDKILKEHAADIQLFKESLNKQKDRQMSSTMSKLELRKKIKGDKLKQKHKAELEKIQEEEESAQCEVEQAQAKRAETKALTAAVHDMVDVGMDAKAQSLIHHLMNQRHVKERIELDKHHKTHLQSVIEAGRSAVLEDRDVKRDALLAQQEQEMVSLMEEALTLSPELFTKKQDEYRRRHNRELLTFDEKTEETLSKVPNEITVEQNAKCAQERLQLKEKHLLELGEALRDMTGNEEMAAAYAKQAEDLALEGQTFRDKLSRETEERIVKIKEEKRKKEEEISQKMKKELEDLEKELEEETRRHQMREKEVEKQHDLLSRRKVMDEEKALKHKLRDVTESEKEVIMAKHHKEVEKIQTLMVQEKDKSRGKLRDQLEARRKKRRDLATKKIEENTSKQLEDLEDNVKAATSNALISQAKSVHDVESDMYATAPQSGMTAPTESDTIQKIFETTDIFKQLCSIEEMLGIKSPSADGKNKARPYIDIRDAQWTNGDVLKALDINKLSPANFVIYRFGLFLSKVLREKCGFPTVTVLLAETLPQNNYLHNAYRHSYYYEEEKEILFVRRERTESVGEFMIIVLHAMTHVHIGDLRDDNNPFFLRHFYRALRVICTDMFFGRASRSAISTHSLEGNDQNVLDHLMSLAQTSSQKYNILSELIEMRVEEPTHLLFSSHQLQDRLHLGKDSNLKHDLKTLVMSKPSEQTYLESRLGVKPAKKITNYKDIIEKKRDVLGVHLDQLSKDILDNARAANNVTQLLTSSPSTADIHTVRLEQLKDTRTFTFNRIQILTKEMNKESDI